MFKHLYKKTVNNAEMQESRRYTMLQEQKEKRENLHDEHRDLIEVVSKAVNLQMNRLHITRSFWDTYGLDYSLQLSEWMRERPEELCDWLLVPCPRGQRCMVVACGKRTEMYSKVGRRCFRFRSLLPGDGVSPKGLTVLDCIFVKEQDTFYVLDTLAFGNQELLHCEAQFRFFWLRSKFDEHYELSNRSVSNEKCFKLLEQYDFEHTERVSFAFQRYPLWPNNEPQLDGFLFYHKQANYSCGMTPLVCWLFPFMVTDMLGLVVSSFYGKPNEYVSPYEYMTAFDAQLLKNRRKSGEKNNVADILTLSMDTDTVDESLFKSACEERHLENEQLDIKSDIEASLGGC